MTNLKDNATVPPRTTVRIPTASGDELEACLYLPEGDGPHPAVVMAHGIGGIKAGGLAPFAERFREEGFVAIAFDYRNFGGSGEKPREVLSVPRQRADDSTVIGWGVEQSYVDPRQIIAWGTSFAGMHIVELAVSDTRLAAAIAQAPSLFQRYRPLAAAPMGDSCGSFRCCGRLLHRHGSAMDVGADKAPRFGGAKSCKQSRPSVSTLRSLFSRFTASMRRAMLRFAARLSGATFWRSSRSCRGAPARPSRAGESNKCG
jgi:X-Pro dipeptidyl-peptidase (S15 family)